MESKRKLEYKALPRLLLRGVDNDGVDIELLRAPNGNADAIERGEAGRRASFHPRGRDKL